MNRTLVTTIGSAALLAAAMTLSPAARAADNMQTADEYRTSKLVGSKVTNQANESIGSVEDIVLKSDGAMDEVVLSVGGFLGMGEKYVAVPFSDLTVVRDGTSLKITSKATKESLKALPEYKFYKP